jgi:DNA-binding XRE family transcriptional regulator
MAIHAYDEAYLPNAMDALGDMMDYAVNDCGMDADSFFDLFLLTGLADKFGIGVPKYVAGMSGIELALSVFESSGYPITPKPISMAYDKTPEFWGGWILAYYQWAGARSFREITRYITFENILRMYPTMHEAPEERFVVAVEEIISRAGAAARLTSVRKARGLTQQALAEKSGVSLRSIQQYEQRKKDIGKTQSQTVLRLARTLGCGASDLLDGAPGKGSTFNIG